MTARGDIVARVEAAIERARFRNEGVRAICLDAADWKAWNKVRSAEWGSEVVSLSYGDVPIRMAKRSNVFTTVGNAITIHKKLSHRVAA